MADLDRGAYTPPTDGGLTFDARMTHRRRPLPITLILSVAILLVLIAALVFLYRAGTRVEGGEPQPVGEPVGAVREAPPTEGQPVDPASGLDVYTDDAEPGAPVFTAPPETPIARPAPIEAPAGPTGTTGLADPAPAAQPAPAPARPVTGVQAPAAPASATPAAVRPAPAARPAPTPAATPPTPQPAPAPTAPAAPRTPAGTAGAVSAQIGAFNTRAQAQAALARQPGGAGQRIEEVQRNGQTLYRAIATGFPNRAAAESYCAGVSGGCIIR